MKKQTAKPLYREVLVDAYDTVRKNKRLLVWGLLAALLGNAGEYNFVVTAMTRVSEQNISAGGVSTGLAAVPLSLAAAKSIWSAFLLQPFSIFMFFVIGLIVIGLTVFFVWLVVVSVVALIQATAVSAAGKPVPSLADGVEQGNKFFTPVLFAYLFGRLLSWFLLTLVVLFGALAAVDFWIGFPLFIVSFLVIVPVLFVISFVVRYAVLFMVLKKQPILDAVEHAIELMRQQWLITIETAFFLFVINLLVGIVLVSLTLFLVIPILLAALLSWQLGVTVSAILLAIIGIGLFLAILFLLGSALGAYQWAAWTHLFLRMKEKGHLSKLVRVLTHWFPDRVIRTNRLRA